MALHSSAIERYSNEHLDTGDTGILELKADSILCTMQDTRYNHKLIWIFAAVCFINAD